MNNEQGTDSDVSRRTFLETTAAAAVALSAGSVVGAEPQSARSGGAAGPEAGASSTAIRTTINGSSHRLEVGDHWTLAELLRDHLKLTGTKLGCERGECGACTVLLDGKPVYSCSYLAAWVDGRSIVTVEGLARNGKLDPLQQAFIEHDAPQCGFCTSGQLMAAKALLSAVASPSADQVRAGLAGNICRCANYNRIVEAVVAAGARTSPPTGGVQ
jgi:xanthine dehydrogenase YagT iron-sulfur-binding subunit